jgi:threonine synthase
MTVAVSKAVEEGARAVICASTGNTAASAAAYAARAGIPALVLQPRGAVAGGKLAQTRALGARVLEVRGSFDEALASARELAARGTHALVNSLNPYRIEGQKTAVFEIVEELGSPPDAFVVPYGGGGNTTAYARGLRELGIDARLVSAEAAQRPTTLASAIRIAAPAHAASVAESGAEIVAVRDEDIVEAWRELAHTEGLFCEPASAAGLAALRVGAVRAERVVVTITGHGLKDPEAAAAHAPLAAEVDPDPDAIAGAAA